MTAVSLTITTLVLLSNMAIGRPSMTARCKSNLDRCEYNYHNYKNNPNKLHLFKRLIDLVHLNCVILYVFFYSLYVYRWLLHVQPGKQTMFVSVQWR